MTLRNLLQCAALAGCLAIWAGSAGAQGGEQKPAPPPAIITSPQIVAESAPYHFEWNGASGTLVRAEMGGESEKRLPLTYLHTDPGPKGYSKYLAWFLARDTNGFAILWCYLNETGNDFWCWLYRFPENQLTTALFTGNYRFTPPNASATVPMPKFDLTASPRYLGPDFTFGNWTRTSGTLPRLELRTAEWRNGVYTATGSDDFASASAPDSNAREGASAAKAGQAVRTLSRLRIVPLHELHIPSGNGWRSTGWRELHTLAYDSAEDPYYLILYNNSSRGFVVDLKRAATYIADFGGRVNFTEKNPAFEPDGAKQEPLPTLRIRRFERHDFTLKSSQAHANPFTEVFLTAEFRSPEGKRFFVPGFWDGGSTWQVRFSPTVAGSWKWRTRSNDPELAGQQGEFDCVVDQDANGGFLHVQSVYNSPHHFALTNSKPFYPSMIREPVQFISGADSAVKTPAPPAAGTDAIPASFAAFQKRVDDCAKMGFNRFIGGYLLGRPGFAAKTQVNEGGAPFVNYDLDHINPAYFQWMDRRVAYCNDNGIVPDIGIGWPDPALPTTVGIAKLSRLWQYILARYAPFNICWNLFPAQGEPEMASVIIGTFVDLTRQNDPYQHPLTTVSSISPDGLDYLTQSGGDLQKLARNWSDNKPLVLMEQPSAAGMTPEVALERLWGARMRGAYWVGSAPATALDSQEARWSSACARFFKKMRFWRLDPHPEKLKDPNAGGIAPLLKSTPQPDPRAISIRSGQASDDAGDPPGDDAAPGFADDDTAPPLVLADPAWEYVVYLENGGKVSLDLLEAVGKLKAFWYNPATDKSVPIENAVGGGFRTFTSPDGHAWVLCLSRR